jgi:ABC-type uncharacterized transport system fused permease/ATPase subunit
MNWKEFLKLTKWKIILFIVIFIISLFIPIWPTVRCFTFECWKGMSSFFDSLESLKNKEFYDYGSFTFLIIIIFVSVVLAYFISSIILRIANKKRK